MGWDILETFASIVTDNLHTRFAHYVFLKFAVESLTVKNL